MKATLADLNRDFPKIRLVLSSSVSGMGFDPPSVTSVVHVCPTAIIITIIPYIIRHSR
jgi:hypothetical protein